MRFNEDFTRRYIAEAPLALALERAYECHILSRQGFERPILDIGCGDGIFASILCKDAIDTGIDPDKRQLKKARSGGGYRELICCGAQKIPKSDGAFKTIFSNSVFEHIVDLPAVLKEARRVLAPDGRMYITVPTDLYDHFTIGNQVLSALGLRSMARRFRACFDRLWKHYHYYDAAGWGRYFEQCGWTVSQCREYNPKAACLLCDSLVPLSIISFFSHRFLNRWFMFPALRRVYTPALSFLFTPLVSRSLPVKKKGGLVFFELRKMPE